MDIDHYISSLKIELKEVYDSRNILYSMVKKNLFGRYKNSFLGFGWHFVTPIIMMCVYFIVFTSLRPNTLPDFWIFISSGIFPFSFMVSNLSGGAGCIVGNSGMIKKMYFPREIVVLAQVASTLIIALIGYIIVLILVIVTGHGVGLPIILLPIAFILMFFFVLGYSLILSAVTVYVRDIQFFLNSISMIFFFMTPMYFEAKSMSGILGTIIWYNPLTYYIEFFHQIVYYSTFPDIQILLMCIFLPIVFLSLGIIVFSKLKHGFTERL